MDNKSTVDHLFYEMGFNYVDMEHLKPYDVSKLGYEIKTPYGWEKITKIIRKNDAFVYEMKTDDYNLVASGDHLVYVRNEKFYDDYLFNEWRTLSELCHHTKSIYQYVLTENGYQKFEVISLDKKMPILDMEVESSHSYFSNGILSHNTIFGSPETTTGGNALKFWASVRLDCRGRAIEKGKTEEDKEGIAREHVITVKKNKVAPPFKKATINIRFGEGLSLVDELINYIDNTDLLNHFAEKAGAWYTIKTDPPEKLSGRVNFRDYLMGNYAMRTAIENALRVNLRLPLRMEE